MREKIKQFLTRLFCRHEWVKTAVYQEIEDNVRFGIREYCCRKCGKVSYRDSRRDALADKAVY